jgi:Mu-like prophage I protein
MARFGYYSDLRGLQFSEGHKSWIQAMRVGEYLHPAYGKISFTSDRLMRFADSVKKNVRGIALDIDYDHKADPTKGNEAAGWVEDAKVEGDALFLLVDWTKSAVEKIKEKAYRYFSPEFQDEWSAPDGIVHRDVLFGGGITNRPFLKDLLPVNLSELTFAEKKSEGKGMDPKELRKALGLPEDATDQQVIDAAKSSREAATNKGGTVDATATTHAPNNAASDAQGKIDGLPFDATTATGVDKDGNMVTPEDVQLSELAKTNPTIRLMLAERAATNKRLAELENAHKLSEIRVKLNEYRTGSTIVAPAVLDEAAKLLAKLPVQLHDDVHGLLKLVQGGSATVQLGELGSTGSVTARVNGKTAEDRVDEAVKKLLSEAKVNNENLTYADALTQVFADDTKLFTEYQSDAYAFKI